MSYAPLVLSTFGITTTWVQLEAHPDFLESTHELLLPYLYIQVGTVEHLHGHTVPLGVCGIGLYASSPCLMAASGCWRSYLPCTTQCIWGAHFLWYTVGPLALGYTSIYGSRSLFLASELLSMPNGDMSGHPHVPWMWYSWGAQLLFSNGGGPKGHAMARGWQYARRHCIKATWCGELARMGTRFELWVVHVAHYIDNSQWRIVSEYIDSTSYGPT